MHDFLEILMMIFFFLKKMMTVVSLFFFFFLKVNERWANAPSLEYEFMSLGKNLDLIDF